MADAVHTIRRASRALNAGKQKKLAAMAHACRRERQHWLLEFQKPGQIHLIKLSRLLRNAAMAAHYKSPNGLPARLWKLSLADAADTMDRWWQALFEQLRPLVFVNQRLNDEQRHYIFVCMKHYGHLEELLAGKTPDLPKVLADRDQQHQAASYLRRLIRRHRPKYPTARLERSIPLDANCYKTFEKDGVQYIEVMTLEFRKRMAIPLDGDTPILGNVRLVLNGERAEVHYTATIKGAGDPDARGPIDGDIDAIDYGFTEVATNSRGERYGTGFGPVMRGFSDRLDEWNTKRNKLRARGDQHLAQAKDAFGQADRLRERGQTEKADHKEQVAKGHLVKYRHLQHCNLGQQAYDGYVAAQQRRVECEINRALNELFKKRPVAMWISEDLRHAFSFGKGAKWNRRLSMWVKGKLQDRVEYKALAEGFRHKAANPAYSSQTCPLCGCVGSQNRISVDWFRCQCCGFEGDADWIAAWNLFSRINDPEIKPWMPKGRVKQILELRFRRRLEISGALGKERTVSGKAANTAPAAHPTAAGIEIRGGAKAPPAPVGHLQRE